MNEILFAGKNPEEIEKSIQNRVENAVKRAAKRGHIDLLYLSYPKDSYLLYIIFGNHDMHFLAEVVERSKIKVKELSGENPFELIVEDRRTKVQDILYKLPAFFRFNYPFAEGLPITMFRGLKSYIDFGPAAGIYLPKIKTA